MEAIQHIHHISAIVGNPEENIRFYRDVLNLKLIKKRLIMIIIHVPSIFSNGMDNGTILDIFNWPNNYKGRICSSVQFIAFRGLGSLEDWEKHLHSMG